MMPSEEQDVTRSELQPATLDVEHVPRFREGVVSLPVGDESVLFEEERGMLHQLDVRATLVCSLFDGRTSVREMVDDLAVVFEIDRAIVEGDVLELVRELGRQGVLEGIEGDPVSDIAPETS
jgi:hypothetical protein